MGPRRVRFEPGPPQLSRAPATASASASAPPPERPNPGTPHAVSEVRGQDPPPGYWQTPRSATRSGSEGGPHTPISLNVTLVTLTSFIRASRRLSEITSFTRDDILPEGYAAKIAELRQCFVPDEADENTRQKLTRASEEWMRACYAALESHYEGKISKLLQILGTLAPDDPERCWAESCKEASKHFKDGLVAPLVESFKGRIPANFWRAAPPSPKWEAPITQTTAPPRPRAASPSTSGDPRTDDWSASSLEPLTDLDSMLLFSPEASPERPRPREPEKTDTSRATENTSPTDSLLLDSELPAAQPSATPGPSPDSLKHLVSSPLASADALPAQPAAVASPSARAASTLPPLLVKRTVHHHNGDKSTWTLDPARPVVIAGASNIKWLPLVADRRVQVDSYPGASLPHAIQILSKLPKPVPIVQQVVLSFAFNHRQNFERESFEKSAHRLHDVAVEKFPKARVLFPLVACSRELPTGQQENVRAINSILAQFPNIPALPSKDLETQNDKVHWTTATGVKVWRLWQFHLR